MCKRQLQIWMALLWKNYLGTYIDIVNIFYYFKNAIVEGWSTIIYLSNYKNMVYRVVIQNYLELILYLSFDFHLRNIINYIISSHVTFQDNDRQKCGYQIPNV